MMVPPGGIEPLSTKAPLLQSGDTSKYLVGRDLKLKEDYYLILEW